MRTIRWLLTLCALGFIVGAVGSSYRNWIRTDSMPALSIPPGKIRLEVVNASGDVGAGRVVAESLSRRGYDVYGNRNNDEILERTRIVDRIDAQMTYARELQKALTVPARRIGPMLIVPARRPEITSRVDPLLYLEATVLLGSDYRTFFSATSRPY